MNILPAICIISGIAMLVIALMPATPANLLSFISMQILTERPSEAETGVISGFVYRPDPSCDSPEKPCGTPATGQKVLIYTKGGNLAHVLRTDLEGKYSVNLLPGEYTVVTSQARQSVIIQSGITTILNIHT